MIRKYTRYFSPATVLLACLLLTACENDLKEVDMLTEKKTAVEEAYQIKSYYSQAGKIKARLTAPYMRRYVAADSPYVEFPRSLHVDFYNDSSRIESTLDARYAKYHENERKVYLRDSVRFINIETHDTLYTPEMWWDQNKEQFYSDKPSERHQPHNNIFYYRSGFRAAQNLKWIETYNNEGKMLVPSKEVQ